MRTNGDKKLKRFYKSVWLFPAVLFLIVCLLTVLKINGSSVGVYHQALYGDQSKDPDLILGSPRGIRSDEWIFITQMTIAQSADNFPRVNENIGSGRDMSLNVDVPYKEWSVVFKPQNLSFFVLPLEYAFAFKWWVLLFLLVTSAYFFVLDVFPRKRLLAAVFGSGFALSPFVFWWYQTVTLAPLFYGFMLYLIGKRLITGGVWGNTSLRTSRILQSVAFVYVLTSFALLLYPPFQIPIVLTVAALLVGVWLNQNKQQELGFKKGIKKLSWIAASCFVSVLILLGFVFTRHEAISAIQNTAYPGVRSIASGKSSYLYLFTSNLMPQLQRTSRAVHYYTNQSEASNFILLFPFLLIPGTLLAIKHWRPKRELDWEFIGITSVLVLFLMNLYVPRFNFIYKILMLNKVPHERLLIGLGFAGFIYMLHFIRKLASYKQPKNFRLIAGLYSFIAFQAMLTAGIYVRTLYPKFISSMILIGGSALFVAFILWFILIRKTLIAGVLLLIFSLASVCYIHPVYRGLGVLTKNPAVEKMREVSKPDDTWAIVDNIMYENLPILADRDNFTGIQQYPDLEYWKDLVGDQNQLIFNRYAHIILNSDPAFTDNIRLVQSDSFQLKFGCDMTALKDVEFVMATHELAGSCAKEVGKVELPNQQFYLYSLTH